MSAASTERGGAPERGEPKLTVRIIHRCQFRCPSCSTFSGPSGRGVLSLADFTDALERLASARYRGLVNISGGEPTLHPELPRMIERASQLLPQSRIAVFTHGHWVGHAGWRDTLGALLAGNNVLVRFSLDRQHAEGIAATGPGTPSDEEVAVMERARLEKARLFLDACVSEGAEPGVNFDFAFKGTREEGLRYTASLGAAPLYLITFRPEPDKRPKTPGFFALDVDDDNRPLVFRTLGHIPSGESAGGLESLLEVLAWNRAKLEAIPR